MEAFRKSFLRDAGIERISQTICLQSHADGDTDCIFHGAAGML